MSELTKQQQQQRLLHIGSIFVAVTLTVVFFILGGGKDEPTEMAKVQVEGLNAELPDPSSEQLKTNKLDIIEQEQLRLMAERANQQKQNNSFDLIGNLNASEEVSKKEEMMTKDIDTKIDINTLTETPATAVAERPSAPTQLEPQRKVASSGGQKRSSSSSLDDYAIRAEERRKQKEEEKRQLRIRYGLESPNEEAKPVEEEPIEELPNITSSPKRKGFKTMGESSKNTDANTIRAVIHGEQKNITKSSQIKLRLLDPTTIDGTEIPRNTIVYGQANFSENRLAITIDNIRYGNNLYPFKAEIYDMDGFRGLYVPDNITNEAKKDASSNAISRTSITAGPNSMTPTGLINTAVNATSSAIQSATQKKVREVKVDLPANYKLLIKKTKKK